MRVEMSPQEWQAGFQDGADGRPAKVGGSFGYLSGWIEGDAKRQGFEYSEGAKVGAR